MIERPHLVLSPARRRVVTAGIMTGMFLAALEATVIATAMPTVIATLGGMSHYSWVFSAYLLSSTVTVPLWGKLSDLYGRRALYQIGVLIFLVGSTLSGVATSMTQLIIYRTIQGIGAGALVPLGMTIVGEIYTLRERARMQGLFSGVWGVASVAGPLVGGFLTEQLSWRWVFFINIPFGIASAVIIGVGLKRGDRHEKPTIDYGGAITLTASMTLLMLALVEGGSLAALMSVRNLALLAASVILFIWFVRIERRASEPIIPLDLFSNRVVSLSTVIGFLAGVAMFGAITFVPLFAQAARGETATSAGTLLTPLMLSWVVVSVVAGPLLLRLGSRRMVVSGQLLMTVSFFVFAAFDRETARQFLILDLVVLGAGLGLTMLTLLLVVQHSVNRAQLGIATSLNQFSRAIGGAVGVALMGAILSAGLGTHLRQSAESGIIQPSLAGKLAENPSALIDPQAQREVSPAVLDLLRSSLASSLRPVFLLGGILSGLALVFAFGLPPTSHSVPVDQPSQEGALIAGMTTIDPENEPQLSK